VNDAEAMATAADNGWEIHTLTRDGQVSGYAMVKGTEIHFKVVDGFEHKVIRKNVTRNFLRPLFDRFDLLTTRVPHDDSKSRRFIERLGFRETWGDDSYNYFMLTALPFER
jgi:hypothetical protein